MAATQQGTVLTAAYQTAQARNAAAVAELLIRLWLAIVKPARLTETTIQWLTAAEALVIRQNGAAADLADTYYTALRAIEAPGAPPFTMPDTAPLPVEQVRTSLSVTGIVDLEKKIEKIQHLDLPPAEVESEVATAVRDQARKVAGSASRLTIVGGIDKVLTAQAQDKTAFGYVRVTHADCCYFCAMLAGRGPVFKDDSFDMSNPFFNGDGPAKVHDSCQCSLEPVFAPNAPWPGQAEEFRKLWDGTGRLHSGAKAILEFRRAYEGRVDPAQK